MPCAGYPATVIRAFQALALSHRAELLPRTVTNAESFARSWETIDVPQVEDAVATRGIARRSTGTQEDAERLLVSLQQLPLPQRETLLLRYSQGLSLAEIAEILEVPIGTVKSRISIGLQRLRLNLEERR